MSKKSKEDKDDDKSDEVKLPKSIKTQLQEDSNPEADPDEDEEEDENTLDGKKSREFGYKKQPKEEKDKKDDDDDAYGDGVRTTVDDDGNPCTPPVDGQTTDTPAVAQPYFNT